MSESSKFDELFDHYTDSRHRMDRAIKGASAESIGYAIDQFNASIKSVVDYVHALEKENEELRLELDQWLDAYPPDEEEEENAKTLVDKTSEYDTMNSTTMTKDQE